MRITDRVLAEKIQEARDYFGNVVVTHQGHKLSSLKHESWTGFNALYVEGHCLHTGTNKELYIFLKGLLAFGYAQKRFN